MTEARRVAGSTGSDAASVNDLPGVEVVIAAQNLGMNVERVQLFIERMGLSRETLVRYADAFVEAQIRRQIDRLAARLPYEPLSSESV